MSLYVDFIEETSFNNAWASAIRMVLANGTDLVIGGAEQRKPIKDSCMMISLTGNAIRQIEAKELHPQFPTKKIVLENYCNEFTMEYLKEYDRKEKEEKFSYLYFDRLVRYLQHVWSEGFGHSFRLHNQLEILREQLKGQVDANITSNRSQAITWQMADTIYYDSKRDINPDYESISPPCLQRIQIRYIPENKVDVHLTWRSRDLYTAWQSNIICLIDMLNREVIKPNNCQIARIIDFNDSLHIYKTDIGEARKMNLVLV